MCLCGALKKRILIQVASSQLNHILELAVLALARILFAGKSYIFGSRSPHPPRLFCSLRAFDGMGFRKWLIDRMDRAEEVIIGSSIRIKNLALLAHLEPAIFKHVLTEEMEAIKIEKTRTADLETSMIENGLAEDRKEARRFLVKIWKPEMVTPPACPCKHLGALMTYIVINMCFAQVPWI